ncbi:MAG TPA: efflux RND transporter permease subunit [Candidatus Elarobacter sp.]|nr:efflux RND transporter permease subunit [Candidatus Elarobacter sp.]
MWLTRFSIQRPIIVAMFFIALAAAGTLSYLMLGKNAQPNVNFPVVVVVASYPGASPAEMERLVIKPIEDQVDGIEHLDEMTATAQEGSAVVVVQFQLGANLDFAAIDVQRRVDTARVYMPTDLDPPQVIKNGADAPVLTYAIDSKTLTAPALADVMNERVISDIRHIPNVETVNLSGAATREFDVQTDPLRLLGSGATLADVYAAISTNNANLPGGRIDKPTVETTVSVHADVNSAEDIGALPLPVVSGAQKDLLVRNVATVLDTHQEQRLISHMNGAPGLILDINRSINSDEVGETKVVRAQMAEIIKKYPQIEFHELFAPADFSQASLNGVNQSLLEGIVLTAIVLMLFLHAWRNAAVVMVAIPSSLLATFVVMRAMGLTLDNVSLMGLSLIIGILVDDSIVVLENITRHRDMGQSPTDAAISGRTEIGGAAIAITLVDVVVFLPLAFLSGFVGEYMKEFGIVVTVATLFSLFVSFTLTPMLAAKWSVLRRSPVPPKSLMWFQTGFDRLAAWYKNRAIPLALRHRWMMFWISVLLVVNAIALVPGPQAMVALAGVDGAFAIISLLWFPIGRALHGRGFAGIRVASHLGASVGGAIGCAAIALSMLLLVAVHDNVRTEFVPDQQTGQIHGDVTFPVGTPLATTEATLVKIENVVLRNVPYVDTVRTYAGTKPSGWGSTDGGFVGNFNVTLRKDHRRDQNAVVEKLRAIVPPVVKGAEVTISGRGGGGSGLPISFTLSGPGDVIDPAAAKLAAYIKTIPGTVNVQTSAQDGAPHLNVRIDPARAAVAGVSPGAAALAARSAVGGVVATKVRTWNGLVNVLLQYPITKRNTVDEIQRIAVRANDGSLVPLGSIATFTWDRAPTKIEHVDKQVIARVNGDIDRSKTTLGEVMGLVNAKLKTPGFLPSGVTLGTEGDSKFFLEFLTSMAFALITSVALIYCLMVVLYGSFTTPLVIMFSIPVAIIGALLALGITGQTINLFSAIGLIMLFGLVAKNGILLVDYANTLRKRGLTFGEAIVTAGGTRLRPIVMTTAAMVFGMLPLATGHTEGGEIRMSMGIVLIGGLLSSLFLTLFLVPAMYVTTARYGAWIANRRARRAERREVADGPMHPVGVTAGAVGD